MLHKFNECDKEQKVKFIIELMSNNGDQDDINHLKKIYETSYNTSFEHAKLNYEYSFLKFVDINQAISLYDSMLDHKKKDFITIIKQKYKHLYTLVKIDEIINDISVVDSIIYS